MKYEISEKEGAVIITPRGKMMAGSDLDKLRDKIQELMRTGTRRLVIDLNRLDWIDSAGLGLLIETFNNLKCIGGELQVACVEYGRTRPGQGFIEWVRLPFKIYDSVEEAVKSFLAVS